MLITGRGTGGSWQIRGEQLGKAIGATVQLEPVEEIGRPPLIIVKKPPLWMPPMTDRLCPTVWDIVDAYPQPGGNGWTRNECLAWLTHQVNAMRPDGIVAATQAMAEDCEAFGVPVLWLPHHARPGLRTNPIRPLKVIGYEGAESYLGRWRRLIELECAARRWTFVVNPAELADVDVVVALRDCYGYAPRQWKSNVKLANAQGSGTPVICCREAGYLETQCGAERWADTPAELATAFDSLTPTTERLHASSRLLEAAPRLDSIATTYLTWLRSNF